jgi:hypothetical protein
MGDQLDSRHGLQQCPCFYGHEVGAQCVDRTAPALLAKVQARLSAAYCGFYRLLQVLHIGRRPFVEDDQVDVQALYPPVFTGTQQLTDLGEVLDLVDAQENQRQITRNPQRP